MITNTNYVITNIYTNTNNIKINYVTNWIITDIISARSNLYTLLITTFSNLFGGEYQQKIYHAITKKDIEAIRNLYRR